MNSDTLFKILGLIIIGSPLILFVLGISYWIFRLFKAIFEVVWMYIKDLFSFRKRRIEKKRFRVYSIRNKYYYAIEDICEKLTNANSTTMLNECHLDFILSIPEDKLKTMNETLRLTQDQIRKEKQDLRQREYNSQWTTIIYLVDMDIISVLEADLERLAAEIKKTEDEIISIETVRYPEGVTEQQKEAIKRLHVFSVDYQVKHDTLKAKLEYLKCAYNGLQTKKVVDEERSAKHLL